VDQVRAEIFDQVSIAVMTDPSLQTDRQQQVIRTLALAESALATYRVAHPSDNALATPDPPSIAVGKAQRRASGAAARHARLAWGPRGKSGAIS
jgi:hypothetical protein